MSGRNWHSLSFIHIIYIISRARERVKFVRSSLSTREGRSKMESVKLFGIAIPFGIELYTALAIVLVSLLLLLTALLATVRRKRADTILLIGLSGSGKTALFYRLRDDSTHQGTVTSMEPNDDCFVLHSELSKKGKLRPVHMIDIPGHPSLRPKLNDYLPQACGIVFLVDALDFMPNVRAIAEYLYDVLSTVQVVKKKIPVLIACNKMDKVTAHSMDFIRKQLEKEIDKLRATRNAISAADVTSEVKLGIEGEAFKFMHCVNKVTITEVSVLTARIADIEQFIREQVHP